jgi:hypothetical protein
MTIPYTYCLTFKPTGQKYYGVRYKRGCRPEDLFQTYFTSSKEIKRLITLYGIKSFDIEIRKTFTNKEKALEWESKVLRRLKVEKNKKWINRRYQFSYVSDGKIWLHDPVTLKESFVDVDIADKLLLLGYVKGRSPKTNKRISTSKIGLQSGKNNPMYGKKRADLSARNSLPKKWITNGTESHQILLDAAIPDGWYLGRNLNHTKKPRITCECKGCGIMFNPYRNKAAKYHSRTCANKHTASLRL